MPGSRLLSFPAGIAPPASFEFSGGWPFASEKRPSEFGIDWLDRDGNIHLHVNPRPGERRVILNSFFRDGGGWGQEESVAFEPGELEAHRPLRLRFDVLVDSFRVWLDGRELAEFEHRRPPSGIHELRSTTFLWRLEPPDRAIPPDPDSPPLDGYRHLFDAEDNPRRAERLGDFRLFAVLSTWMEEDVVAATVANCLAQGCERVYLVDNDSPDRTVQRATAAGAVLASTYSTDAFSEFEKIAQMQAVVDDVSAEEGDAYIWWLWLDADEFHHGPRGLTLRQYLGRLDRRFRVVGGRFLNHMPTREPAYVDGRDPLELQPLCYEIPVPNCSLGHFKHPLQRSDRDGAPIRGGLGAHSASSPEPLVEPIEPIVSHHFPYRAEAVTRARLERFYGIGGGDDRARADSVTTSHMILRLRSLDAVYRQRWEDVTWFPPCAPGYRPELADWRDVLGVRRRRTLLRRARERVGR